MDKYESRKERNRRSAAISYWRRKAEYATLEKVGWTQHCFVL
jgi:hypothetical protein